ncbi:MAG: protease inhibitor I42 family protein [Phycisphaerae bacterium]|nr:protease inhibitor I42 family protein [Phycisphaerae bacterium]
MKVKTIAVFLLVGSAAMMWGCLDGSTVPANAIELDEMDNGTTIVVTVGDVIAVTLDSNATTGYRWEVADLMQSVVAVTGNTYVAPSTGTVGAGGSEVWTFSAQASGTTNLLMEYRRSGDTGDPAGTFRVTFIVGDSL